MLLAYIGGGFLIYVLGILGISYAYGKANPHHYSMEDGAIIATVLWPLALAVVLVFGLPVALIIGMIMGMTKLSEIVREKAAAPARAALEEQRRTERIQNEVNSLQFFDESDEATF